MLAKILSIAPLVLLCTYLIWRNRKLSEDARIFRRGMVAEFPGKIDAVSHLIHRSAMAHGFWKFGTRRNKGEAIALIHSEASELLEVVRGTADEDDSTSEMEEIADIIIRCCDYARGFHPDRSLGDAITDKISINMRRPHKHNKQF